MSRKALCVGINKYTTCPLSSCCDNAKVLSDLLSINSDGSPNFSTKTEYDVQTKGELRRLIEQCFSGNDEIALFYYSGHGYVDALGGYLVTPDYTDGDYGVSLQDILTIANRSKCREKIVILDSCFSGKMGTIPAINQNTSFINEGVTILTACNPEETAIEVGGHGLFTSLLIDALQGGAADITGNITPGGIYAYIDKALGPWEQRPIFKTNVTHFTSLRYVSPQVDIGIIRKICEYFPSASSLVDVNPSFEPTNSPDVQHKVIKPYANPTNTRIFSDLQKLEGIGLVIPVGEEHMYFAAMNSKQCALTSVGKHYWRLVKEHYI